MTAPVMMKNSAGSNEIFVNLPILLNMSFSDHAHNPIARQTAPTSWKYEKEKYINTLDSLVNNWTNYKLIMTNIVGHKGIYCHKIFFLGYFSPLRDTTLERIKESYFKLNKWLHRQWSITHVHLIITHGYIVYILKKKIRLHIYIEYMTVVSDIFKFTVKVLCTWEC